MNTRTFTKTILIGLTAISFAACNDKHENNENNTQTNNPETTVAPVVATDSDWKEERKTFKTDAEARIQKNEEKIAELRAAKRNTEGNDAEYKAKIDELEAKNKELKQKANDYNDTDDDESKWQSFKREFNHDADEVYNGLNDIGQNNVK